MMYEFTRKNRKPLQIVIQHTEIQSAITERKALKRNNWKAQNDYSIFIIVFYE